MRHVVGVPLGGAIRVMLLVAGAWLAAPLDAAAMDSCSGTFSATVLRPAPHPLLVAIDVPDDSPRNIALAGHFETGLRAVGVEVSESATAIMSIDARFLSQEIGDDAGSFSGIPDSGAGGVRRYYPGAGRLGGGSGAVGPQTLLLRAELRSPVDPDVFWFAVVQCRVQTADVAQLAYDMGTIVGPLIGQRRGRTNF